MRNVAPDLIVHFGALAWRSVGGVGYPTIHVLENDTGPDDCNHAQFGSFVLASSNNPLQGEIQGARLLDIAPTLLELGGYDLLPTMQGRSLVAGLEASQSTSSGYSAAEEEVVRLTAEEEKVRTALESALVPAGPMDSKNCFLEIRAGAGGDEAGLFAAELYRMYSRFAERRDAILRALHAQAARFDAVLSDPDTLLEEVTALVEYPSVYAGRFDTEFLQTATRPINIVSAAIKKGIPVPRDARPEDVDSTRLDSEAGALLLVAAHEAKKATDGTSDTAAVFVALKKLEGPINKFFTDTMVMVDDAAVRDERLKLLSVVSNLLFQAGDLSKIVIEG